MIFVSEIHCNLHQKIWNFKNCLICEQFTCRKTKEGWNCSCALNTDTKDNYHYGAIWQTELCILTGTMTPDSRMIVNIQKEK